MREGNDDDDDDDDDVSTVWLSRFLDATTYLAQPTHIST